MRYDPSNAIPKSVLFANANDGTLRPIYNIVFSLNAPVGDVRYGVPPVIQRVSWTPSKPWTISLFRMMIWTSRRWYSNNNNNRGKKKKKTVYIDAYLVLHVILCTSYSLLVDLKANPLHIITDGCLHYLEQHDHELFRAFVYNHGR